MSDKFIKNINLQRITAKEEETKQRSLKNLAMSLRLLDSTTSFLITSIREALNMYKASENKLEKDFLMVYLNIANACLHIIRSSRWNLIHGYYGSVMVLNRALQNYLYTLMYVHHEPQDCEVLINEDKDTFRTDKLYKQKFHEQSLRNYLKKKGYDIPEEELQTFAKVTHGSIFSSQIFGYKSIRESGGEYDVLYAPEYDVTKAVNLIQLLIPYPLDFARFFILHFKQETKKWNKLISKFEKLDKEINVAISIMDKQYEFFKNATDEELTHFFEDKIKDEQIPD